VRDHRYATRIRAGDPDAFAELYDESARSVYNHAFRLTADWSVAEDVMSATFVEAWRRRASIEAEGGSPRPWLLGIATNVSRSHGRGNRRYRAAASAAAGAGVTDVADCAEEIAGRLDDRRRIAATPTALASLKRPERVVAEVQGRQSARRPIPGGRCVSPLSARISTWRSVRAQTDSGTFPSC
jgi:RNA polymerase sigma-70 factor (ECF subfamily)